jgi:hypothetical protein
METPKIGFRLSSKARENLFVITYLRGINKPQAVTRALETEASLSGTKRDVEAARQAYRRELAQQSEVTK